MTALAAASAVLVPGSAGAAGAQGVGAASSGPVAVAPAGTWVWPVAGPRVVVRPFDPPATRYSAGHRGADVGAAVGTAVRAAGAGRVAYAGLLAGRGVVVVVHGELRTTYEPVAASVRVGSQVAAGAVIGLLTVGGHCLAGCLHWGLLRGDQYLDPVRLVRRGPSVLLPVPDAAVLAGGERPALRRGSPVGPAPALPTAAPARQAADPVRPAVEPSFSLRAAEAPWGAGAVLALVLGLLLLRRPATRPTPPEPPRSAAAALARPTPQQAPELMPAPVDDLVDLTAERTRRRGA